MALYDAVVELFKLLIPPKADDAEGQIRWRWVVFMGLTLVGSGLALHISLAQGVFPSVFPGYALETETRDIQRRVGVIATLSLEHEMREKMAELCHEKDSYRRSELNDDLSKLQREYWDVNRAFYNVPGCTQL